MCHRRVPRSGRPEIPQPEHVDTHAYATRTHTTIAPTRIRRPHSTVPPAPA
jgi:hypothetical protein